MIENRIGQQNLHIHRQNVLHLSTICNLKKTQKYSYCPTQSHDQRIMSRHLKKDLQLHPENPRINCHDPVMQHTLSICVLQYVGFVYMLSALGGAGNCHSLLWASRTPREAHPDPSGGPPGPLGRPSRTPHRPSKGTSRKSSFCTL